MQVTSTYRFARISAFKAREVTREIQGRSASDALDLLAFSPKKAAVLVKKTLKSAIANAENNAELKVDTLLVKEAVIGEGPTFKRFRARARGSASSLRKRTSHIRIVLSDDLVPAAEKPRKKRPSSKTARSETRQPKKQPKTVTAVNTGEEVKQISAAPNAPDPLKPAEPAAEAKSGEEKE
jgi:large subunit ribosomal protein L22